MNDADEFWGPSPCQEDAESPAPENTENSLEPGSHFQSKCCDINTIHYRQGGSRCGCSPRKNPGMNSPAWPPSPASLTGDESCRWFCPVEIEGGVDFRNQVSSQLWTPGNPNTPSPTSTQAQEFSRNADLWKVILFLLNSVRSEQDARMSELEGLQRRLTSTGKRGCQGPCVMLPKVTFSHKHWARCPEEDYVSAMASVHSHRHV